METRPETSRGRNEQANDAWWSFLGTLFEKKVLVLGVTGFAAVASVVISLLLPVWYQSTAKVIIPTGGSGGGIGALLGNLDPAASALLGTSGGDYLRYVAILSSRTLTDRVIDEFDLMDVYETGDSETPWRDTRKMLSDNASFEIDQEFDFLAISVYDQDRERATAMANFFVDELNRMNVQLATESAHRYRVFVERRYDESVAALDSATAVLLDYQKKYGLLELEEQSKAFLALLAEYRVALTQAEIEYEALLLEYGENNPAVKSAHNRFRVARQMEQELLQGKDPLMPIAISDIPEIARGYGQALREVTIYQKILEFARPLLEQAIFEEQRQAPAVQVLDRAVVAEWKAKPKRALIVIGATLSVFILMLIYIALLNWLRRHRSYLAERITGDFKSKS